MFINFIALNLAKKATDQGNKIW